VCWGGGGRRELELGIRPVGSALFSHWLSDLTQHVVPTPPLHPSPLLSRQSINNITKKALLIRVALTVAVTFLAVLATSFIIFAGDDVVPTPGDCCHST
jgi:hypothetical protein